MSLKSMAAAGIVKKTDLFKVKYSDLQIEPGFNLRDLETPAAKEHIYGIFLTIKNGGTVPPMLVRVDEEDNIFIVDGHCRHAAYGMAIEAGCPIEWIFALPDRGNAAERVVTMLTSSQGKGLTPLETALGYKRLTQYNWGESEIAATSGRSEEHVKQLLVLAFAEPDVQEYVRTGAISAYSAIDVIRRHSAKAGQFIAEQLESAQKKGKTKITKAGIEGRAIPKKLVTGLMSSVQTFTSRLENTTRQTLAELENQTEEQLKGKTVAVDAAALLQLLRAQSDVDEARTKQDKKTKAQEEAAKQVAIDV